MKIVVDAMGGDHAPKSIVEGVVMAVREYDVEVILTGLSGLVEAELSKFEDRVELPIEVVHAEDVVEMHETPSKVLRNKKKSSIKVGLELVKDGHASAFVSAGNTGAVLAFATFTLRPLKGVDRPAIAIQLPTLKGPSILLDAGANVDQANNLGVTPLYVAAERGDGKVVQALFKYWNDDLPLGVKRKQYFHELADANEMSFGRVEQIEQEWRPDWFVPSRK